MSESIGDVIDLESLKDRVEDDKEFFEELEDARPQKGPVLEHRDWYAAKILFLERKMLEKKRCGGK